MVPLTTKLQLSHIIASLYNVTKETNKYVSYVTKLRAKQIKLIFIFQLSFPFPCINMHKKYLGPSCVPVSCNLCILFKT